MSTYSFVTTMPENGRLRSWQGMPGVPGSYRGVGQVGLACGIDAAGHTLDDVLNPKRVQLCDFLEVQSLTGGDITFTSAPTIHDGYPGQLLWVLNVDPANSLILQDRGTLSGSKLFLTDTLLSLGPMNNLLLRFSSTVGGWVQASPLVVVLPT